VSLKEQFFVHFSAAKVAVWIIGFFALAWFLNNYEKLMNAGYGLNYGGYAFITSHATNLFNEGIIGYGVLVGMALCFGMFLKELLSFQKLLQSLGQGVTLFKGGEKI
jgi:hypothetical protein